MGAVNSIVQGVSDAVSDIGKAVSDSPLIQTAITVGGQMMGVPAPLTAAVLGANTASQTGNINNGLGAAALSAATAWGADKLLGAGSMSAVPNITGPLTPAQIEAMTNQAGYGMTALGGGGNAYPWSSMFSSLGSGLSGFADSLGTGLSGFGTNLADGFMSGFGNLGNSLGSNLGSGLASGMGSIGSALNNMNSGQMWQAGLNTLAGQMQAEAARDAAKTQSEAQIKAAQIAADAAKFKPVGVTTGFGSSKFGFDDKGNLTSAGYELTPEMKAQRDALLGTSSGLLDQFRGAQAATEGMGTAAQTAMRQGQNAMGVGGSLFDQAQQWRPDINQVRQQTAGMGTAAQRSMALGNQYLATDPQAQAQKYLNDQLGLLAPQRAQEMAALQAQMQAQGRGGFAIGGGVGGQGAANPQLQALFNAQLQQNNQLAADATRGGMDYAKFGAGLAGTGGDLMNAMYATQANAYNPYNTALQTAMNTSKYGTGMVGTGGDLLSSMYNTQTAAFNPYKTALGGAQTIEGLGQNALTLGMDMGKTTTAANTAAGGLLGSGMTQAANTMAPANAYSPWANLLAGGAQALQQYKFGQ